MSWLWYSKKRVRLKVQLEKALTFAEDEEVYLNINGHSNNFFIVFLDFVRLFWPSALGYRICWKK